MLPSVSASWEHFFEILTEVIRFMANEKIIAQKQAVVAELKEKLQRLKEQYGEN